MREGVMNNRKETKSYYNAIADQSFMEWFNNPALLSTLTLFISHLPSSPIVLDIGCGTGGESKRLSSLGAKVIGIDFSDESIKLAKANIPDVQFILMDILDMKFQPQYFDGVIEAGVLFHFTKEEQDIILGKVLSYLKANGRFLSYYPQGDFEGMQDRTTSGKQYKRYLRQLSIQNWIDQVLKAGFHTATEHEFNIGSFKCVEFSR